MRNTNIIMHAAMAVASRTGDNPVVHVQNGKPGTRAARRNAKRNLRKAKMHTTHAPAAVDTVPERA